MILTQWTIEQFPKNKNITNLSEEQKDIRKNQKKCTHKDKFTCVKCGYEQPIQEFYIADRKTGRRHKTCRDCKLRAEGVVEIGKYRFSKKIFDKGFRRCSICKDTKPITEYYEKENNFGGHSNNCKDCGYELTQKFIKSQREIIGLFHIKQYGKQKYGIVEFDENTITKLKNEIIENRKPKYFIDGKSFVTIAEFARYIENKYGLPITTTEKRILAGKTEEQCKLTEYEARCKFSGTLKGKIKVVDIVTKEEFIFESTRDIGLTKMFSSSAITKGIKTGEKTRMTSLSKYKNPCIISRI